MTERPAGHDHDYAVTLENPRAERVAKIAALAGRSARSKAGLFLVEGPQGVREAVRHAPGRVRDVYMTPDAAARYGEIVTAAQDAGLYFHLGTEQVLHAMSADAQGVLAVVETAGISLDGALAANPSSTTNPSSTANPSSGATPKLVAVLSNVRDPGNAGTAIRVADAAGADAVVLVGETVDIHNPKVVRSTAGSLFHLPVVRGGSLADAVEALHAANLLVIAADGSGTHELIPGAAGLADPTAWVFGNEAWGLTEDELALVDDVVRIPIFGQAESLNLATATAVCLYASALAQNA